MSATAKLEDLKKDLRRIRVEPTNSAEFTLTRNARHLDGAIETLADFTTIDLGSACRIMREVEEVRHDSLDALYCTSNQWITGKKLSFLDILEEAGEHMDEDVIIGLQNSAPFNEHRTPDGCHWEGTTLHILDFSVSRALTQQAYQKTVKYQKYVDALAPYVNCELTVVGYDVSNREFRNIGTLPQNEPDAVMRAVFVGLVDASLTIESSLLEKLDAADKKGFTDRRKDENEAVYRREFSFSLTKKEYEATVSCDTYGFGLLTHGKELSNRIDMNINCNSLDSKPGERQMYRKPLKPLVINFSNTNENTWPLEGYPESPDKEAIECSYLRMEESAKEHFDELQMAKPSFHFLWATEWKMHKGAYSSEEDTKVARLREMSKIVRHCAVRPDQDPWLLDFLKALFQFQDIDSAAYKLMKDEGGRLSNYIEVEELSAGNDIRMAKYETIVIENKKVYDFAYELSGIGEVGPPVVTKVKSLPFWDETACQVLAGEFIDDGVLNQMDEKKCLDCSEDITSLFEGLVTTSASPNKGVRIIMGRSPNVVLLALPAKSVMEKGSTLPYYMVTFREKANHNLFPRGNSLETFSSVFGEVSISKPFRLDRPRIATLSEASLRLKMIKSTIREIQIQDAGTVGATLNSTDHYLMLALACNVSINTSSFLDNMRYMIENVMADFSFAGEYIQDKMMVACKNKFQAFLYTETRSRLLELNNAVKESEQVKQVYSAEEDKFYGHAGYSSGAYRSILFSLTYVRPSSLLNEVRMMFFTCRKGMHEQGHNRVKLHKTPIEIDDKSKELSYNNILSKGVPIYRQGFNYRALEYMSHRLYSSIAAKPTDIRKRFLHNEHIEDHPLSCDTFSSTRSVLVEESYEPGDSVDKSILDGINTKIHMKDTLKKKETTWKRLKKQRRHQRVRGKLMFSRKLGMVINRCDSDHHSKQKSFLDRFHLSSYNFAGSGVVLTEVIKRTGFSQSVTTGRFCKELLMSSPHFKFLVRPKGQRTQEDREIYVLNLAYKASNYPIEHFYKSVCTFIPEEKISVAGDKKILDMKRSVEGSETSLRSINKKDPAASKLFFNLDMTKWAPGDNLYKFLIVIACCPFLTKGEKYYMMAVIRKSACKLMYIDCDLAMSVVDSNFEDKGCIYERVRDGNLWTNIRFTWLQGQLNYLSSFVHVAMQYHLRDELRSVYAGSYVSSAAHSDDAYLITIVPSLSPAEQMRVVWYMLDTYSKVACMALSKKKCNISDKNLQFISQYILAGEELSMWSGMILSCLSGLPHTGVKDDVSSVLSKITEALRKGASRQVATSCLEHYTDWLRKIYGFRADYYRELRCDPNIMPSVLIPKLNSYNEVALETGGASQFDKSLLIKLVEASGGDSVVGPQKLPLSYEQGRSVRLYHLFDVLSTNCSDQYSDPMTTSLNPLRWGKFKDPKRLQSDPFQDATPAEKALCKIRLDEERPSWRVVKPSDLGDLEDYYKAQYGDSNFRAALAGQSPLQLQMKRVVEKWKPNVRFRVGQPAAREDGEPPLKKRKVDVGCLALQLNSCRHLIDDLYQRKEELFFVPSGSEIEVFTVMHKSTEGGDASETVFCLLRCYILRVATGIEFSYESPKLKTFELFGVLRDCITYLSQQEDHLRQLWQRHISGDIAFGLATHTKSSAKVTDTFTPQFNCSVKVASVVTYRKVMNPIPLLLMYAYDNGNFIKEGRVLPFPESAQRDLVEVKAKFLDGVQPSAEAMLSVLSLFPKVTSKVLMLPRGRYSDMQEVCLGIMNKQIQPDLTRRQHALVDRMVLTEVGLVHTYGSRVKQGSELVLAVGNLYSVMAVLGVPTVDMVNILNSCHYRDLTYNQSLSLGLNDYVRKRAAVVEYALYNTTVQARSLETCRLTHWSGTMKYGIWSVRITYQAIQLDLIFSDEVCTEMNVRYRDSPPKPRIIESAFRNVLRRLTQRVDGAHIDHSLSSYIQNVHSKRSLGKGTRAYLIDPITNRLVLALGSENLLKPTGLKMTKVDCLTDIVHWELVNSRTIREVHSQYVLVHRMAELVENRIAEYEDVAVQKLFSLRRVATSPFWVYLVNGHPEMIPLQTYVSWAKNAEELCEKVTGFPDYSANYPGLSEGEDEEDYGDLQDFFATEEELDRIRTALDEEIASTGGRSLLRSELSEAGDGPNDPVNGFRHMDLKVLLQLSLERAREASTGTEKACLKLAIEGLLRLRRAGNYVLEHEDVFVIILGSQTYNNKREDLERFPDAKLISALDGQSVDTGEHVSPLVRVVAKKVNRLLRVQEGLKIPAEDLEMLRS